MSTRPTAHESVDLSSAPKRLEFVALLIEMDAYTAGVFWPLMKANAMTMRGLARLLTNLRG